jgi:hypothetical protein
MESGSMKSIFEEVLASPSGRMVVLGQSPLLVAAVNDTGRAALFVRATLGPTQVVSDGQGFSVKTTRSGENDYVQITAADRGVPSLFLTLVSYVIERVSAANSADDGVEALTRSIEEYRRFVGQRRGRLSEAVVRGTFAELLFLRTLIAAGMSAGEAVTAWRGPWAKAGLGVHDFTFADGRGVEVKSTRQPPGRIRVSSPSQLTPTNQPLDLVVLPIEEAPARSNSSMAFRQYAERTGELIALAGPTAAETWDDALEALNLDLSDEWYDRYRFVPGEWRRFEVAPGFPHLYLPSLPGEITDVRYSLELAKLATFARPFGSLFTEMGLK